MVEVSKMTCWNRIVGCMLISKFLKNIKVLVLAKTKKMWKAQFTTLTTSGFQFSWCLQVIFFSKWIFWYKVRPPRTRPRGTWTSLGHDFKKGSKIFEISDFGTWTSRDTILKSVQKFLWFYTIFLKNFCNFTRFLFID